MDLRMFDSLESTNKYCELLDLSTVGEFAVICAKEQTAGIGQRGNCWHSEAGKNLTFSLVLKPTFLAFENQYALTKAVSLGIVDALEGLISKEEEISIKWPNDIVLNKKKICGILTEAIAETGQMIIGVGINTNQESMPEDLSLSATSILMETDDCIDHDSLLDNIIYHLEKLTQSVYDTGDLSLLRKEYEDSLVSMNTAVTVLDPAGEYDGICKGIDDRGQLIVEHEKKETRVYAGEVSVRGIYGYV